MLFGFLTKANYCRLFLLPLERLLCGAHGREKVEGILVPHMLLSQKPNPKEKQVINLDQDVHVCEYFCMDGVWTPFMNYLSLFLSLDMGYLSLSLS